MKDKTKDGLQQHYDSIGTTEARSVVDTIERFFVGAIIVFVVVAVLGALLFFATRPDPNPIQFQTSQFEDPWGRKFTPASLVILIVNIVAAIVWTEGRNWMHVRGLKNDYQEFYNHYMNDDEG